MCVFVCFVCVYSSRAQRMRGAQHRAVALAAMGKLEGEQWRALTPEQTKEYDELALKDQERYQKELAQVQRADA